MKIIWNGEADLANKIFGDNYGIDWTYVSKHSDDIKVYGRLIKIGDEINYIK